MVKLKICCACVCEVQVRIQIFIPRALTRTKVKQIVLMSSFSCNSIYIRELQKCTSNAALEYARQSRFPTTTCLYIHSFQIPSHFIYFTGNSHIAQCECTCNQIKSKPRIAESQPKFEWKLLVQCHQCRR
jgi:hypothetical protein